MVAVSYQVSCEMNRFLADEMHNKLIPPNFLKHHLWANLIGFLDGSIDLLVKMHMLRGLRLASNEVKDSNLKN